jgi:hypothetical protein
LLVRSDYYKIGAWIKNAYNVVKVYLLSMAKKKNKPKQKRECSVSDWTRFVSEATITDGDTNVKGEFKSLTKKFGLAYIEYCKVAWQANDGCLTEEEFCRINGNIPKGFFDNKVRTSEA